MMSASDTIKRCPSKDLIRGLCWLTAVIAVSVAVPIETTGLIGPRLATVLLFLVAMGGLAVTGMRRVKGEQARDQNVDLRRLLEFTQSIQGAGQSRQIHEALAASLHDALGLAGLITLGTSNDAAAGVAVLAEYPAQLCNAAAVSEMERSACPCLRQNLPREFKTVCTPIRCGVDRALALGSDHAAYCIPMNLASAGSCLVHMLLPPGGDWTEPRKHLAHAYVNAACSALMTLHALHDAERRSMTDPLTQLYNRLSMDQLLQREIALAERHDLPFSLVVLDLDEFKQVNDRFGHAAGDHLLKSLGDCIRMTLRKTDLAFRLGGDEFVIALPQTDIDQAQRVVEKLRQAFASVDFTSAIAQIESPPTLSVGLVQRDRAYHLVTLPALLAAADQALYEAKGQNRNCLRVYHAVA